MTRSGRMYYIVVYLLQYFLTAHINGICLVGDKWFEYSLSLANVMGSGFLHYFEATSLIRQSCTAHQREGLKAPERLRLYILC